MNNQHTYIAIMAGGVGSRFWPASRTSLPKQFLDILGVGKSLIRLTFERFGKLCPAERIYIVTNAQYKDLVREHLPELSEDQILLEPSRNNTAPCVAYTALKLHALDPAANLVVAPSDHIILDEPAFLATLRAGLDFTAREDALLTLGIEPTRPDTGYGYIRYEEERGREGAGESGRGGEGERGVPRVHKVLEFKEKPPLETARQYLAAGNYLWNAGIFVWRVECLLAAFRRHAAEIHDILAAEPAVYNTAGEQAFIDRAYPATPSISIDYAIMEKAENVYTIPSSFGWSDLGTWASLHAESEQDAAGNVLQGDRLLLRGVTNSLVRVPDGKLVVLGGLDDYIVVDEGDILLVWPKAREQEIKTVTGEVAERFGEAFL